MIEWGCVRRHCFILCVFVCYIVHLLVSLPWFICAETIEYYYYYYYILKAQQDENGTKTKGNSRHLPNCTVAVEQDDANRIFYDQIVARASPKVKYATAFLLLNNKISLSGSHHSINDIDVFFFSLFSLGEASGAMKSEGSKKRKWEKIWKLICIDYGEGIQHIYGRCYPDFFSPSEYEAMF